MTNIEALSAKCTRICSAFYADNAVLQDALFDAGIKPNEEAKPQDPEIIRQAIILVKGYAESSHNEGGISTSVNHKVIRSNIIYWCKQSGLDVSEFVDDMIVIKDGSNLW